MFFRVVSTVWRCHVWEAGCFTNIWGNRVWGSFLN
jgi:hypothetical protein